MKELDVALGFDESSTPVRIAQWEAGTRNPKPDAVEKMASILKFNPDRLSPSPDNLVDAIIDHFLWEDDDIAASEKIRLFRFLFDFWTMRTRLQEGSITPEQYDEWKLCIGYDENGDPIIKRLSASDEIALADKVVEAMVKSGRIREFLNQEIIYSPHEIQAAQSEPAPAKTNFKDYILK